MNTRASHEDLPRFVEPMLLRNSSPPSGDGWASEVKWDGMRAQLRLEGRDLTLRSRQGRVWTAAFPDLAPFAGAAGARQLLLDGELVCLDDEGRPSFARLRQRLTARAADSPHPATLMIFDILHLDGRSARSLPYSRRRELLEGLGLEGPAWRTPRAFVDAGDRSRLHEATNALGLEGVVLKRLDSAYQPGRRGSAWLKDKHRRRERFVITGWVPGRDGGLDDFLLARPSLTAPPTPAGRVTFGLDPTRREALRSALSGLERSSRRGVRWVEPTVAVTVDHSGSLRGAIRDGVLRAAEIDDRT